MKAKRKRRKKKRAQGNGRGRDAFTLRNAPVIGAQVLGIRYRGGQGKQKGSRWEHKFKEAIEVLGGPKGTVVLRSKKGTRLWDYFDVTPGRGGITK